jgi:hypothetical protein
MGDLRGHCDCGQPRLFYLRRLQLGKTAECREAGILALRRGGCCQAAGQPGTRRPTPVSGPCAGNPGSHPAQRQPDGTASDRMVNRPRSRIPPMRPLRIGGIPPRISSGGRPAALHGTEGRGTAACRATVLPPGIRARVSVEADLVFRRRSPDRQGDRIAFRRGTGPRSAPGPSRVTIDARTPTAAWLMRSTPPEPRPSRACAPMATPGEVGSRLGINRQGAQQCWG